jgi:copper chaperone CopZ
MRKLKSPEFGAVMRRGVWSIKTPRDHEERSMHILTMTIDGMRCDGCADRIRNLLTKESGVREVTVSYDDAAASVTINEHATSEDRVREVIERAGFSVVQG